MKMARRLRCSSVTYPLRYAPSTASPARTALPAARFDRNETYAYFGVRKLPAGPSTPESISFEPLAPNLRDRDCREKANFASAFFAANHVASGTSLRHQN